MHERQVQCRACLPLPWPLPRQPYATHFSLGLNTSDDCRHGRLRLCAGEPHNGCLPACVAPTPAWGCLDGRAPHAAGGALPAWQCLAHPSPAHTPTAAGGCAGREDGAAHLSRGGGGDCGNGRQGGWRSMGAMVLARGEAVPEPGSIPWVARWLHTLLWAVRGRTWRHLMAGCQACRHGEQCTPAHSLASCRLHRRAATSCWK